MDGYVDFQVWMDINFQVRFNSSFIGNITFHSSQWNFQRLLMRSIVISFMDRRNRNWESNVIPWSFTEWTEVYYIG